MLPAIRYHAARIALFAILFILVYLVLIMSVFLLVMSRPDLIGTLVREVPIMFTMIPL